MLIGNCLKGGERTIYTGCLTSALPRQTTESLPALAISHLNPKSFQAISVYFIFKMIRMQLQLVNYV